MIPTRHVHLLRLLLILSGAFRLTLLQLEHHLDDDVHHDKRHEDPYGRPRAEAAGTGQIHADEDVDDGEDVPGGAHPPVSPVEDGPLGLARVRPTESHERVDNDQGRDDHAYNRVGVLVGHAPHRPTPGVDEDDDESGERENEVGHHERPVYGEPDLDVTERARRPRALVVARE